MNNSTHKTLFLLSALMSFSLVHAEIDRCTIKDMQIQNLLFENDLLRRANSYEKPTSALVNLLKGSTERFGGMLVGGCVAILARELMTNMNSQTAVVNGTIINNNGISCLLEAKLKFPANIIGKNRIIDGKTIITSGSITIDNLTHAITQGTLIISPSQTPDIYNIAGIITANEQVISLLGSGSISALYFDGVSGLAAAVLNDPLVCCLFVFTSAVYNI